MMNRRNDQASTEHMSRKDRRTYQNLMSLGGHHRGAPTQEISWRLHRCPPNQDRFCPSDQRLMALFTMPWELNATQLNALEVHYQGN